MLQNQQIDPNLFILNHNFLPQQAGFMQQQDIPWHHVHLLMVFNSEEDLSFIIM